MAQTIYSLLAILSFGLGSNTQADANDESNISSSITFKTSLGDFSAEVFVNEVPNAASFIADLARKGAYNKQELRILRGFKIVANAKKQKFAIPDEFAKGLNHRGPYWVGFENKGPNTTKGDLYITLKATPHLDNRNIIVGKIIREDEEKLAGLVEKYQAGDKWILQKLVFSAGEWKAKPLTKIFPLAKKEIETRLAPLAKEYAKKLAPQKTYGELTDVKLIESTAKGLKVQASFQANFSKIKYSRLLLHGEFSVDRESFEYKHLQFSRGQTVK